MRPPTKVGFVPFMSVDNKGGLQTIAVVLSKGGTADKATSHYGSHTLPCTLLVTCVDRPLRYRDMSEFRRAVATLFQYHAALNTSTWRPYLAPKN